MRTERKMIAFFVVICALLTAVHGQGPPLFHFTEKPGPYPVGLKVVEQYDYSRIYRSKINDLDKPHQGERARPLQTASPSPAVTARGWCARPSAAHTGTLNHLVTWKRCRLPAMPMNSVTTLV